MQIRYGRHFLRNYAAAPSSVQRIFDWKVAFLRVNLNHPSLRAKKYSEGQDVWQARVTGSWRFYFIIDGDTYRILDLTKHPK